MKIQVLVDNPRSWIVPYAHVLVATLRERGHTASLIHAQDQIESGDVLALLGCEKIMTREYLQKNRHNLVIHESALPHGKGWSPLTWQILEGKNEIPVTLIEAVESVDAGPIYAQKWIKLQGHELVGELRKAQGETTNALVLEFVDANAAIPGREQQGADSFYPRRRPEHSQLDLDRTLRDQFNLLRVVDNERYPAYFEHLGCKFLIKIEKA